MSNKIPSEFQEIREFQKLLADQFQYKIVIQGKLFSPKRYDKFHYYHSMHPFEFLKYKAGICWDFVAYEDYIFKNQWQMVKKKLFYIEGDPVGFTHTFLVYWNENDKPTLFESILPACKGCFEFKTERDLLTFMGNKVFQYRDKKNYFIKEYEQPQVYGLTAQEFMDYVVETGKLKIQKGNYLDKIS